MFRMCVGTKSAEPREPLSRQSAPLAVTSAMTNQMTKQSCVGAVTIGDVAAALDPSSVLADINTATSNA
jgi:hypothetical protein